MKGGVSTGVMLLSVFLLVLPVKAGEVVASEPMTSLTERLLDKRQRLDQTIWSEESMAQQYESRFTALWNSLLYTDDRYAVLASFPFSQLYLSEPGETERLDLQILRTRFAAGNSAISPEEWRKLLDGFSRAGYTIEQTEWHHSGFTPPAADSPALSTVSFEIHALRNKPAHRVIIKGELSVAWSNELDSDGLPVPATIRVTWQEILERHAQPAFREVFRVSGTRDEPLVLPLHVYDLNRDGLSEIVVGGQNMLIWNGGNGRFTADTFLKSGDAIFDTGVIADFTGDSFVDFIGVNSSGYPLLYRGSEKGTFASSGEKIADIKLSQPKVFTAGDIDADGDLDVFVASYKYPYRDGQMPTPYYDANDGFPAYLLRNDGNGKFADITHAAGLAKKRYRRTFSGSFIDLDEDSDQDLVVVSDYAGLDMYLNNGNGVFEDVTEQLGVDRHFFGMGHTFADYDLDGSLDMYIIGMSSTTARRLEGMGAGRADMPQHNQMRKIMGYGNRIFLSKDNQYHAAPFNDQVARTGWSWGASSFDFDNDGDKDIFVTNGHYSGKSTQDYCTTFWRHDIYEESRENKVLDTLFQEVTRPLRQADISWNGYEHKVLFMNEGGESFVNIAFLMGVAFEYDARSVVADDLDADGRVDLLVVEFITEGMNRDRFRLHVYQNVLDLAGHWVGVRLQDQGPGLSPIGATVTLQAANGSQITRLVTGDSFSSQHSSTVHFGLGAMTEVDSISIRWPNGKQVSIEKPLIDQYHEIPLEAAAKARPGT